MARYAGEKFFIDPLPPVIDVDAGCRSICNILKKHESDVKKIRWKESPGTGLKLLDTVKCQRPYDHTGLDVDLWESEGQRRLPMQILAERVLLLGAKALREHRVFGWSEFFATWQEAHARLRLDHIGIEADSKGQSLRGTALFHCADECPELLEILAEAYEALDGADIKIVIANSREGLDDCVFPLQPGQLQILVDIHSDGYKILDCGGLIHSSGDHPIGSHAPDPAG